MCLKFINHTQNNCMALGLRGSKPDLPNLVLLNVPEHNSYFLLTNMNWETSQMPAQRYTIKRTAQMLSWRIKASRDLLADWTKKQGACFLFSERWTHLFFSCSSGDSEILSSSLVLLQGQFLSAETTSILRKGMATEVKRSLQIPFSCFPLNNSKS